MKILAISNLHGRVNELQSLLHQVNTKEDGLASFDQILFLGDYIGYGKKTNETIKALLHLKKSHQNVRLLKGDWEDATWKTHRSKDKDEQKEFFKFFVHNQQKSVLDDMRSDKALLKEWLTCIEQMPAYFVVDRYVFTHAGVDIARWKKDMTLQHFLSNEHTPEDFLWSVYFHKPVITYWANRMLTGKDTYPYFPYTIVSGQTPIHTLRHESATTRYTEPFSIGNMYGIDFGARYEEGRLGVVVFSDEGVRTYSAAVGETIYQPITAKEDEEKEQEEQIQDTIYALYQSNQSIKEIATHCQLKEITVINHLLTCFKEGRAVDISPFYKKENESVILTNAKALQTGTLQELKQKLPKGISYAEIKTVLVKHKLA